MRIEFDDVVSIKGVNYENKFTTDFSEGKGKQVLVELFESLGDGVQELPLTENQRFVTTEAASKLTGEVEVYASLKEDGALFVYLQELEED